MNDICLVNCRKKCRSADVCACIFNNKLGLRSFFGRKESEIEIGELIENNNQIR